MTNTFNSKLTFLAIIATAACTTGGEARSVNDSAAAIADSASGQVELLPASAIRFTVASTGNSARYRIREQLMGKDLPNDAIAETTEITGVLAIDSSGAVIPSQSRFTVATSALKSDSDRRDGYVRGRILETTTHPTVTLVPKTVRGLPANAAATANAAGPVTFDLVADLTVRGVTRPTTWRVTATQKDGRVTGTASTKFTFTDFDLPRPRVPIVLSVADSIGLEYDFTLVREAAAPSR
jgi:polyisoprenoid-binding protein YceI